MKGRIYKAVLQTLAVWILLMLWQPLQTYAFNVTPVPDNTRMNTMIACPVYQTPDLGTTPVVFLERFVNVTVTGITDNGFYRINLNGNYYIPGVYLVQELAPAKTEKQKALEDLQDFAECYAIQLEQMESYSPSYALLDVTGDGIPELFDSRGREIYTYYDDRVVMIYYSENPVTFYYAKDVNALLGKYSFLSKDRWEIYVLSRALLPWGQFQSCAVDASLYQNERKVVSCSYTNDEATRGTLYNQLKEILSL